MVLPFFNKNKKFSINNNNKREYIINYNYFNIKY